MTTPDYDIPDEILDAALAEQLRSLYETSEYNRREGEFTTKEFAYAQVNQVSYSKARDRLDTLIVDGKVKKRSLGNRVYYSVIQQGANEMKNEITSRINKMREEMPNAHPQFCPQQVVESMTMEEKLQYARDMGLERVSKNILAIQSGELKDYQMKKKNGLVNKNIFDSIYDLVGW